MQHKSKRTTGSGSLAWPLLASLALASCGGGSPAPPAPGGAAGGGAPNAPAPSPSPVNDLPPAPFGLTANTPFALTGYQSVSGGNQPTAMADEGALAWSADLKTYTQC